MGKCKDLTDVERKEKKKEEETRAMSCNPREWHILRQLRAL